MANILVIDDDRAVLRTIKILLEQATHVVETVDNGRAGLQLLEAQKFDLLIVDIFMPGMDGFETMRLVRRSRPEIPIIVIQDINSARLPTEDRIFSTWPPSWGRFRAWKSRSDPTTCWPPLPRACRVRRHRPGRRTPRKQTFLPTDIGISAEHAASGDALRWREIRGRGR